MTPIIVLHPFRRIMSSMIHRATRVAAPMEMDETISSASGGLYVDMLFFCWVVLEAEFKIAERNLRSGWIPCWRCELLILRIRMLRAKEGGATTLIY